MFDINIFDEKWPVVNTLEEIKKKVNEAEIDMPEWDFVKTEYLNPNEYEFIEKGIIRTGDRWDENYTYFFTTEFIVPDYLTGKNLYLALDICGESEVYIDNVPRGSIDVEHSDVRLSDNIKGGEVFNIKVQAAKHAHNFVRSCRASGQPYRHHVFNSSKLVCKNRDVEAFYHLAKRAVEISVNYEEDKKAAKQIYEILKAILCEVDYYEEYSAFTENIKKASERLLCEIQELNISYKYGKVLFMGQSHLDLAFKWDWKETFRKIERTLSNTCEVLHNYPDGVYIQSQVKILEVLEQSYPDLYNKVVDLVNEGRVEPVGDIYVEFDTNIPSGESLIRQILYGKKFNKSHFKRESRVCYLPDTFGYSGILPQILAQAGYQYFVTTKLEWNDTNKPPYLFFNWHGIDGTEIMSHLLISGYGGDTDIERIHRHISDPRQKGITDIFIYQYGASDGGGGISEDMIQSKAALKKLSCLFEVCDETLENSLDEISKDLPELPSINGELYFEKHRGVYTSQADIKKYNRKSELTLRNAEILSVIALNRGYGYPRDILESAWKKILFNQFHDIIAGSCIGEAADEAVKTFKEAIEVGNSIINDSLNKMVLEGTDIIIWNTLGWKRNEVVEVTFQQKSPVIKDGQDDVEYQIVN